MMHRRDGLKLLAGAPLCLLTPTLLAAASRWSQGADMPFATQEIYPAKHKGELLVAGGIGRRAGVPFFPKDVVAYNPSEDRWRTHSTFPEARHHGALVSTGDQLYLLGGFNGGLGHIWRMRQTVHEWVDNQWKHVTDLPRPQAEGVAATARSGRIHVVTGQSPKGEDNTKRSHHAEIRDHWSWLPGEDSWEAHAPIPTPRNSATGGWIGDHLVVAGGRTASGNLNDVEIYSATDDAWRTAAPLPLPQAGTASVVHREHLIVFGGEIFQPEPDVFPQVWCYSLKKDRWEALPDLPTPRHGLGAVAFDQKAYVVGGARRPSGSGTSKLVEILDLTIL